MINRVAICNIALGWLGANLITSIDDDTTEGHLCRANYEPVRDAVLEAHNWAFATKWAKLVRLADNGDAPYASTFQLPVDMLHVTFCGFGYNYPSKWRREGQTIVTDASECLIQYVFRNENDSYYPPLFVQAVAARLAADLALPLVQSRTLQSDMYTLYLAKVKEAASRDNQQGTSRRIRSKWLVRGSGFVAGPYV